MRNIQINYVHNNSGILIPKQVARVANGQIEYVLQFEGLGFDICCMHEFLIYRSVT